MEASGEGKFPRALFIKVPPTACLPQNHGGAYFKSADSWASPFDLN